MDSSSVAAHTTSRGLEQVEEYQPSSSFSELPSKTVNDMKFHEICDLFRNISRKRGKTNKLKLIFTNRFRKLQKRESMYPLMRLIIPNCDTERINYGIKAAMLANVFSKALGWVTDNPAAKRLKNWKDPRASDVMSRATGDFPSVLRDVLLFKGFRVVEKEDITVKEVNDVLDELRACTNEAEGDKTRAAVINKILLRLSAKDIYWLVRIILKDMKMHLRHENVLKMFHPDANSHFNTYTDLRRLCSELNDPTIRVVPKIELFQPLQPMLAQRTGVHKKVTTKMGDFLIEEKFDGERALIHYDSTTKQLMYFSRNKVDFTELFEPSLRQTIEAGVKAKRCILDGELLAWDNEAQSYIAFGSVRTVAKEIQEQKALGKSIESNGRWLKLVVFDLIFLEDEEFDGGSLMGYPLRKRLQHLRRVIPYDIPNFIQKSNGYVIRDSITAEEKFAVIKNRIDDAIAHRKEGIMVKELDSHYVFGRSERWLKVKPDYIDGLRDDLDVILLGGYYGEGWRRSGDISSFLVGVVDRDDKGGPNRYLTFGKVGTGYTMRTLEVLRERLEDKWMDYNKNTPPLHLRGWNPGKEETPDFVIMPEDSVIMSVNAAEICPTDRFSSGYVLRFPRAVKLWRDDKSWDECMTFDELKTLYQEQGGSIHGKRKAADLSVEAFGRKRTLSSPSKPKIQRGDIVPQFRPTDLSNVVVQSSLFSDSDFHVITGKLPEARKVTLASEEVIHIKSHEDIDKLLQRFGARNIFRVMPKGFTGYIIATDTNRDSLRNENLIRFNKDILLPDWVFSCIKTKKIQKPKFGHYLNISKVTRREMKNELDRFYDHHYQMATLLTLQQSMRRAEFLLQKQGNKPLLSEKEKKMLLEDESDPLGISRNCLRGTRIYFDNYHNIQVSSENNKEKSLTYTRLRTWKMKAPFYGCDVSEFISNDVTHIVVENNIDKKRYLELCTILSSIFHENKDIPRIVKYSWIKQCIESRRVWQYIDTNSHLVST